MHQNLDHKATKCEKCLLEKTPIPRPDIPPKPLILKPLLEKMKERDEAAAASNSSSDVVMGGAEQETQKEIDKLKAFIKQAK